MRTPDWEFTQGDEVAPVIADLTGTDGAAQVLGVGDTVAFNYQRSGGRGEPLSLPATVVSLGSVAAGETPAVPARVSVNLPSDMEAGRYESAFIVTFATGDKDLHWPSGSPKLFGRIYKGFIPEPETSP